jgi:hypothetical protein
MDKVEIRVVARITRLTSALVAMKQKECVWEMKLR